MSVGLMRQMNEFLQRYGRKLVDIFYWSTTSPIIIYGIWILLAASIGVAIAYNGIYVPYFHPE